MKISHRLIALSSLSAAGLLCVAAVSFFAVTSIQAELQGLTLQAAPLQARTLELQERTERLLGSLLRLSLARNKEDVDKVSSSVALELTAMDKLRDEIKKLDPKATDQNADFRAAQTQIAQAAQQRMNDDAGYRSEAEAASAALSKAEQAIAATRTAVNQIGLEAGQAADKSQDAGRRLGQASKQALLAQNRLKDVLLVVSEVDTASNRFRLGPLKERAKAPLDSLQRLEAEAGSEDHLKETRALGVKLWDLISRDNDGLLALRTKQLAKAEGADAAYASQRKTLQGLVDEQSSRLGALIDGVDMQAVKQRQTLEAALRLRNEPGGVVTSSEEVSLTIRDMVGGLRLLMLAASEGEAREANTALREVSAKLGKSMQGMRAGLAKMNRQALVQQVDGALAAVAVVNEALDKLANTKLRLLASEAVMAKSLEQLKVVAARQAVASEKQVKSVTDRQVEVTASVDRRVQSSIVLVLGIAAGIIALIAVLGVHTVRTITQRLNAAVRVAEQVSQGRLVDVPVDHGKDEMSRLMTAMGTMVGTLRGIVSNIQSTAERIDAGSQEISRGNQDLSTRTEEQAARLQQTASSLEELAATVAQNADGARNASALAAQTRQVASQGGEIVLGVVGTMTGIQESSRRIAEIVGVIDGIAFQTNILALNAAVEAARAGEQGRGFAVVASEVRSLAGKSAQAAQMVKQIVNASVEHIDAGSKQVRDAGTTMQGIVSQVNQVSDLVEQISRASQEQASAVASVNQSVTQIDQMTQRNAALAEQGTAAAMDLRDQAESLAREVSVFQHDKELVGA